jgi:predicted NAD-dependent protein-ADP-ribosyltransferase YbiA (DUF1768 family)
MNLFQAPTTGYNQSMKFAERPWSRAGGRPSPISAGQGDSKPPNTLVRPRANSLAAQPMRRGILFYRKRDPYYGFTNFSPHPVLYRGQRYPTSEHLFQSFKVRDQLPCCVRAIIQFYQFEHRPELAEHIRTCSEKPGDAFSEARRFTPEVRVDWKDVRISKVCSSIPLRYWYLICIYRWTKSFGTNSNRIVTYD